MKRVKVKISVEDYIKLGGSIESLKGMKVYKNQGNYYNPVILNAIDRKISRGKRKGQSEIRLTIKYTYGTGYTNEWTRSVTTIDKYFIDTDVSLIRSRDKLDDITNKFLQIPNIIHKELRDVLP